ncbi:hypothetical protein RRF57_008132 [Xylaria bambusicola]|uniref:Uncharacterized protein n=1 Tax=Xylaria bambusicola TaxID=326684 RepID=A0AAN7UT32_9PEZI
MASEVQPSEDDICWLFNELERYHRRPPWFNEPDPFDPVDPIFQRDTVVYLAYRGAKRRAIGSTRFMGQANLRQKIDELDNATPSYKEAVVSKISEMITVDLRDEVISWADERGRKKRQLCVLFHLPLFTDVDLGPRNMSATPSVPSDGVATTMTSTNDSPRVPSRNAMAASLTIMSPPIHPTQVPTPTLEEARHNPRRHSFDRLSMSKAEIILPDHLFGALDKLYSTEQETFSVRVGMEYQNADDGTLSLGISSDHIDPIAETLFGIHLLSSKKNRYYRIGKASIAPGLVQDCAIDSILGFFGELLTGAIQASAIFELDRVNKSSTTQAVALQISHDHVNDPGILILHIGLCSFVNIWKTLSPVKPIPLGIPYSESIPPLGVAMVRTYFYMRHMGLTYSKPFALHPLDLEVVFDDAQPTPCWIIGKNQQIYWRRCFMRVYSNTNKYFAQASCEICDGQCIVPEGKELFLGGKGGYVKVQE